MSNADISQLLSQLTVEEKVSLLSGRNFWETVPIPRLSIPSVRVSDGPNGARGGQFENGTTAACFPASVCLAATWDDDLVANIGGALAGETVSKGASVLLGPTVCPHRSPLGGRNFESFSEDPFLAGKLASAYIKGLQAKGVGATIKHFVANEQETKRFTMSANISERALREIYLKPFEIAIKDAKPWALMTSYNLINGVHADMNTWLLQDILRKQWGFQGLVMSDWGGTNSTIESFTAGLDLEMPGPANRRKFKDVKNALDDGKISTASIDAAALAVLTLVKKAGKFEYPDMALEQAINRPEDQSLIRKAGAQGIVLLKNEDKILPLQADKIKNIALLGLAKECLAHGGGSASVNCHYKVTPFDAFKAKLGEDIIHYSRGVQTFRILPSFALEVFDKDGLPGFTASRYQSSDLSASPEESLTHPNGRFTSIEVPCKRAKLVGTYRPSVSGRHYLSFSSLGPGNACINGTKIFNVETNCSDPMGFMFGAPLEEYARFDFRAGEEYEVVVEAFAPVGEEIEDEYSFFKSVLGVHLGFMLQEDFEKDELSDAVRCAEKADVAVVFVGNTSAWETEGLDQTSMNLPVNGSQDRLISAIATANPNTIVINSTGVAISMPWLSSVKAVIQTWFPGQEAGNSIADVVFGDVNPSGRLPISIPKTLEDSPAFGNFPGDLETLQVDYKEGIYIGYRFYDKHPEKIQFPFGFGLSYTEFEIGSVSLNQDVMSQNQPITVQATVRNIGAVEGSQIVQAYLAPADTTDRPQKTLVGYSKVTLAPGSEGMVEIVIGHESAAFWDASLSLWKVLEGSYDLLIGSSSQNIAKKMAFTINSTFTYKP